MRQRPAWDRVVVTAFRSEPGGYVTTGADGAGGERPGGQWGQRTGLLSRWWWLRGWSFGEPGSRRRGIQDASMVGNAGAVSVEPVANPSLRAVRQPSLSGTSA